MARSPNYGRPSRRPSNPRKLYVVRARAYRDGLVLVTLQEPGRYPVTIPARDQGHAVCLVELCKDGLFGSRFAALPREDRGA